MTSNARLRLLPARFALLIVLMLALSALSLPAIAQDDEEGGDSATGTTERVGEMTPEYTVAAELVAEGLTSPVDFASPDDGTGRRFIVDQAGTIRILTAEGELLEEPFLDLTGEIVELDEGYDERGVLGLAFHPDYANNGRFFVYYTVPLRETAPEGWNHTNVVSEFTVSADNPDVADPASGRIIWEHDHPAMNHNAGHIRFGPDGYLYIPYGDGGGADDVGLGHTPDLGNGQDLTNQFGSILRIDVDGAEPYDIPADNPFIDDPNAMPEIYAYGFRNPFDISFDADGNLYASDAGQNLWEEVSMVEAGGNYGWNIMEATHCFDPEEPDVSPETCAETGPVLNDPLIDPIVEYSHDQGVVVVGAFMYRGSALPDLQNHLIFADWAAPESTTGVLFWAEPSEEEGGLWEWGELYVAGTEDNRIGEFVLALGEDLDGELYVLTKEIAGPSGNTGKVWQLTPEGM